MTFLLRILSTALLGSILLTLPAGAEPIVDAEPAGQITGQIRLIDDQGEWVRDRSEFEQAVAYFEPQRPAESRPLEEPLTMTTRRRQFEPRVLTIPAGTEVIFPNEDPILHNVFSTSGANRFDLGLYGRSEGKIHRFDQPGLVRVFCNVHPAMSAHIVVVNSRHFLTPDPYGRFELTGLPLGPGRLTVWHERAEPRQFELDLDGQPVQLGTIELTLTVRQLSPQRERLRRPGRRGRY